MAEIDPDALGLGQQRQGLGADPRPVAGDGIAGDIELSVCVLDRMVHVGHRLTRTCRALAARRDRGIQRRKRLAQSTQVGERVGVDAGWREAGESCPQLADRVRDAAGGGLLERGGEVATGRLDERGQRGLRSQRLDLEGLHRIEEGRCSAHRCNGCLERDVRLLAQTGRTPPLAHAHAVLGESEQLIRLRNVGLHVDKRLLRIAGGEAVDGLAGVRDASAQTLGVRSYAGDDLGCVPRPRDPVGERGGLLIELVLSQFAQLHDAQVTGPHLVGAPGDRLVIEAVQTERVPQVPAHGDERRAQLRGRVDPQLRLGEAELVDGDADAFVCGDQGPSSPLRQVGVVDVELLRTASAPDPEHGHAPS